MKQPDNKKLKDIIKVELKLYKFEFDKKNYDLAFRHLERVHIISQPFPWRHTFINLKMLQFALLTFRPIEIIVQLLYSMFSAKFSTFGIYPTGNTGGANAIFKGRMAFPIDLEQQINISKIAE
jgi:hypothetical protein